MRFLFFGQKKANKGATTIAAEQPTGQDGERSHAEIMVIVVALMMAMLLSALDQTIVSTALPRIASDLNGLNKLSVGCNRLLNNKCRCNSAIWQD